MSYKIAYEAAHAPPRGPAIVAFMEDFYRTSDTESLHEKYVQSFTEDATLIMGPKEAKGAAGMTSFLFSMIYTWVLRGSLRTNLVYSPITSFPPGI